ncbi:MAG: hypothetical protein ACK5SQ_01000 [Chitinophagales bacterium]|jgi:hypothetical protein
MKNKIYWQLFMVECMVWLAVWLLNDYLAALLTAILGSMVFAVWLIAQISEYLEPSRVPSWYFSVLLTTLLATLSTAGFYVVLNGGLDFLMVNG